MLNGKTVLLGVSGGIAAYKAVNVASLLRKMGATVHAVLTANAEHFVGEVTFRAITDNPVHTKMFGQPGGFSIGHIALAERADLLLLCPATANVVGKIASGIADDFLTTVVMACTCPKIVCPAMNSHMYESSGVQENLDKLRSWGYHILEPEAGRLASGAVGKGRLPDPDLIVEEAVKVLTASRDLQGVNILITAGPTREWLDPVRFISPPSTGKMGYALAEVARDRGAQVTLISGPVSLKQPFGVRVVSVDTTSGMLEACKQAYEEAHVVIGAAAPSDFRPTERLDQKLKKSGGTLTVVFEQTEDILATLGRNKGSRIFVGFAAETRNLVEYAREKIESKNLDFVCANRVDLPGQGFASDDNAVTLVHKDGRVEEVPLAPKRIVAAAILDRVKDALKKEAR